jgi:hypothetical protein
MTISIAMTDPDERASDGDEQGEAGLPATTRQELRIEVYVRKDLRGAFDRIDAVIERLDRIETEQGIGSVRTSTWANPSQRCSRPTAEDGTISSIERPTNGVRTLLADFTEWATRHGCSLAPAFDLSGGGAHGDERQRYRLPIIGLAVYDGVDELLAVYPHTDRTGEARTIEDGLAALKGM